MERMVNTRLTWYLEKPNFLFRYQNGFRQNQGTNDWLIRLETFICNGLIRNHHVVTIFFYLEKAYDTTWKYGILKELHKIWITGDMATFVKKFLSHRTFRVQHGNVRSDLYEQETRLYSICHIIHPQNQQHYRIYQPKNWKIPICRRLCHNILITKYVYTWKTDAKLPQQDRGMDQWKWLRIFKSKNCLCTLLQNTSISPESDNKYKWAYNNCGWTSKIPRHNIWL